MRNINEIIIISAGLMGLGCAMFSFVALVGVGMNIGTYISPNWYATRERSLKEIKDLMFLELVLVTAGIVLFSFFFKYT